MTVHPQTDVVILGSGLAGSVLAMALAAGGARVLVLDAGSHPRFAIGESTIPYTSMLTRIIAERYGIPELKWLSSFENVQSKISTSCGIKRNFGFLYHRRGQTQDVTECHELPLPKITYTENHFFRQDIDAWLLALAVRYGVTVRQRVRVTGFDFRDNGVTVTADSGETFLTRFVVDASGFRSPLAAQLGLREEPPRLRHHSRSLFTHMMDVTPYEKTLPPGAHGTHTPWSQGTLHHVFEGGWIWVIPFNNHARATNPLVSVGLSLDPRIYPKPDGPPEREFNEVLSWFPSVARQFAGARAVREWVSTGRLQYSSRQTTGYRWCLTSHAAGFIDALFSRGMTNTLEIVNALAWRLLAALHDDDFAVERFKPVQDLEQGLLDFNDSLVANAYTSFRSFELWDAWVRVWSLGLRLANFEINRGYARFADSRDPVSLERLERLATEGCTPDYPPAREFFAAVGQAVRDVADGSADPATTASMIMRKLHDADFIPPPLGLHNPGVRSWVVSPPKVAAMMRWSRREAPPEIGQLVREGLFLFMKRRLARDEFDLAEELRHKIAAAPFVGRPLRVPTPR
jgi:FADH2 O2-dependent halogenase